MKPPALCMYEIKELGAWVAFDFKTCSQMMSQFIGVVGSLRKGIQLFDDSADEMEGGWWGSALAGCAL